MERQEELKDKLLLLLEKDNNIDDVCAYLDLSPLEVLGLVKSMQDETNIVIKDMDDGIHLINRGDDYFKDDYSYEFDTDDNHEFKFIALSDTMLGSKSQQLSILNDIYKKGHELGYNNVIVCGNISAGLYPITGKYATSNFVDDTVAQSDYIIENFPEVEGMTTYFITGKRDNTHLKTNKVSIGKKIDEARDDIVFLGEGACEVAIDNVSMQILAAMSNPTRTVSYRTQQQIDSYRSEDKPDILLYGGLLQMEKYTYRNVKCLSVPSVCATTPEMNDHRLSNTVGAWYVTIKTNELGQLESFRAINSPYYETNKKDYKNPKVLKLGGKKNGSKH